MSDPEGRRMAIILPGTMSMDKCSLCDEKSVGIIMVFVIAIAGDPEKTVSTQMEFTVCEQHSLVTPVGLEKKLRLPERKMLFTF